MAGALENIRKRRARQSEALAAAKSARPVNPSPSTAKKGSSMGAIMKQIRDANPPVKRAIRKYSILGSEPQGKTGGLRGTSKPTSTMTSVNSRIQQLEQEMAAKKKAKLKSRRLAKQDRTRRAMDVLK